jgi:hypothetical protein
MDLVIRAGNEKSVVLIVFALTHVLILGVE